MNRQELYAQYLKHLSEMENIAEQLEIRFFIVDSQDNCVFQGENNRELPFLLSSSIVRHKHLEKVFELTIRTIPITKKVLKMMSDVEDADDVVEKFLKENGFKTEGDSK